ncbi:uncharacterized protein STEHIDRAFT_168621, partial [Stereum hirsutum FP-91666 SS1]|uniref:uncharacterized protein n=1 Tax=Stereum hirsutum (strain FP-91666) TaxID=721885 RepID=UPI000440B327
IHPRLESHLLKALSSPSTITNTDTGTPTNIPSKSNAQLSSRVSLLATSIDTTLLRLQLLRACFEESLYSFSAPPSKSKSGPVPKGTHTRGTGQSRTFAEALQSSSQKLSEEESRLAAEEEELDRKLAEYEALLDIVDRDRGVGKERKRTVSNRDDGRRRENNTFGQVVDDWARVKKETEECVRDLRRLGWAEG